MIWAKLLQDGYSVSKNTVRKYMNCELGLKSIVRPKKNYSQGVPHAVFPNLLQQDFTADTPNQKWCIDFTYIPLMGGGMRYNCTVIDLYRRKVVASVTDGKITADLAIRTVKKALASIGSRKAHRLILHSDQGSQFTSKAFVEFCAQAGITQSMSRAGYPYDNAVMERYFNTLKNECLYHQEFRSEKTLYRTIEHFAYVYYNYQRPHSYNNYTPPCRPSTLTNKHY